MIQSCFCTGLRAWNCNTYGIHVALVIIDDSTNRCHESWRWGERLKHLCLQSLLLLCTLPISGAPGPGCCVVFRTCFWMGVIVLILIGSTWGKCGWMCTVTNWDRLGACDCLICQYLSHFTTCICWDETSWRHHLVGFSTANQRTELRQMA